MGSKKRFEEVLNKYFGSEIFTSKEIFSMWFPLILDALFINGISLLTTSMISSSGQESIAAVSMINPLTTLLVCGLSAIATGGTVIVAQYKGKGDEEDISRASGQTIIITMVIAIAVCTIFIVFARPIVLFLYSGAEKLVIEKAVTYLAGASVSLVSYAFFAAVFAIFRGLGETKLCLRLTVYINLSYFVFSFIFLNIMHLDVLGTSFAYILARTIGAVAALVALIKARNTMVYIRAKDIFRFDSRIIHNMLKISLPFGMEQFVLQGGSLLVQKYMVVLGTQYIAANAVANSMLGIIYAGGQAVGNLSSAVIGRCIGAGKRELARFYGRAMLILSTFALAVGMLLVIPFMSCILPVFNPSAEIVPVIHKILTIALVPMLFLWPLANTTPNVLRSAGDATYTSVVSLASMWALKVGAGYLVAITFGFGIMGFWVCGVVEWLIRAIFYGARIHGNKWLTKNTI